MANPISDAAQTLETVIYDLANWLAGAGSPASTSFGFVDTDPLATPGFVVSRDWPPVSSATTGDAALSRWSADGGSG